MTNIRRKYMKKVLIYDQQFTTIKKWFKEIWGKY